MRIFQLAAAGVICVLLAACAGPGAGSGTDRLAAKLPGRDIVLLGDVHDNAEGQAARHEMLARAVSDGWRPVLAMEQFDHERQPALDRAQRECTSADCVVAAAGAPSGWDWNLYKPLITLALEYKLPLVAANLSRADASLIVRKGLSAVFDAEALQALGLATPPASSLLAKQAEIIAGSHCGMLPPNMLEPMALAQIARDAVMAHAVRNAAAVTGRPVVLLAGAGHVRQDIGVPYWLDRGTPRLARSSILSVGFVESAPRRGVYDYTVQIAPAQRPDPCAGFQVQGGAGQR